MKKWKRFYMAAWIIIIVMFLVFLFASLVGVNRIYIKGINFILPNKGAYELYKIDDTMAVEITNDGFISVVGYEKTKGLESLAGRYRVNGEEIFMVTADYKKGDYIYSNYPQGKTSIVNAKTGEWVGKAAEESDAVIDIGTLKEYQDRNLVADEKYRLTKIMVQAQFEKLNTFHEGRYTLLLSFLIIIFIMCILGIPIAVNALKNIFLKNGKMS